MESKNDFTIITWKGHVINLETGPTKEQVDIEDIAHHLSHQGRFVGACNDFYSNCEHSLYAGMLGPKMHAVYYLLHDMHEYIYHDLTSPLKRLFREKAFKNPDYYKNLCDHTDKTIIQALGLNYHGFLNLKDDIKEVDKLVYQYERKYLFGKVRVLPSFPEDYPLHGAPFGMDSKTAEYEFMQFYRNITA